jgi:hypothetical protein
LGTFYPLPSAFAFRSGAIASKHNEDGQERKWLLAGFGFADSRQIQSREFTRGRRTIHSQHRRREIFVTHETKCFQASFRSDTI